MALERAIVPISTHILDTALGRPAADVEVSLERLHSGEWLPEGAGATDIDGRCRSLLQQPEVLTPGLYRIRFETAAYYERIGVQGLYPYVEIAFQVRAGQPHYHIPLLLTPNSYTTYRGS